MYRSAHILFYVWIYEKRRHYSNWALQGLSAMIGRMGPVWIPHLWKFLGEVTQSYTGPKIERAIADELRSQGHHQDIFEASLKCATALRPSPKIYIERSYSECELLWYSITSCRKLLCSRDIELPGDEEITRDFDIANTHCSYLLQVVCVC